MGDRPSIARVITQLASKQQRNITRAQLQVIGLGDDAIDYRLKTSRLFHTGYPGVYTVGTPPITPHEHAMAAVLACGSGSVLSRGSALSLWGIWKRWDRPFHVSTTLDRRPKGIKVHRITRLDRRDLTRHYGIPVTTLAKALLDMAPQMRLKSLNRAVNNGRLDHHLSLDALADVVRRHPTQRGAKPLKYLLGIAPERPSRSDFERSFPAFCARHGLPLPQTNVVVCGHEVDALFPREKLIVELDGWPSHSGRISFEDDRNRDADTLAGGFATIRITSERYERTPDEEAARIHTILAQRRAA